MRGKRVPEGFAERARGAKSVHELSKCYGVHATTVKRWLRLCDIPIPAGNRRAVEKYDLETGEVLGRYPSNSAAARESHGSQSSICKACNGRARQAYGYGWRYVE